MVMSNHDFGLKEIDVYKCWLSYFEKETIYIMYAMNNYFGDFRVAFERTR